MSSTITLRVSDEEKSALLKYAEEQNRSLSNFARLALLEKVEEGYWAKRADKTCQMHPENPNSLTHEELTGRYGIRFTDEERALIEFYAEEDKRSFSDFVRVTILETLEREADLQLLKKALGEHEEDQTTYSIRELREKHNL